MGERSMSFSLALQDLSSLIQKIAAAQIVPESVLEDWPEALEVRRLAKVFTKEEAQLFYQISITSRPDLSLAPDEQTGFAMALLRMLAFRPAGSEAPAVKGNSASTVPTAAPARAAMPSNRSEPRSAAPVSSLGSPVASAASTTRPVAVSSERPDWHTLMRTLPVKGLVQQLAFQTELQDWADSAAGIKATIVTPTPSLASDASVARLTEVLTAHFGKPIKLTIEKGEVEGKSVAKIDAAIHQEKRQTAEQMIAADPLIQALEKEFGAKVVNGSVKPL
jgi:DNA polymerase-3 subunit gamma/tau